MRLLSWTQLEELWQVWSRVRDSIIKKTSRCQSRRSHVCDELVTCGEVAEGKFKAWET